MSELDEQLKAGIANYNAQRHLALFVKTGNGLLIWRAYQEYRKAGVPVPENILKKLDQFAERLLDGDGDLLDALDLGFNKKGGQGPRLDLQAKQRGRDIVEFVRYEQMRTDCTLKEAYRLAAEKFCTTPGAIEKLCKDWPKRSRRW